MTITANQVSPGQVVRVYEDYIPAGEGVVSFKKERLVITGQDGSQSVYDNDLWPHLRFYVLTVHAPVKDYGDEFGFDFVHLHE